MTALLVLLSSVVQEHFLHQPHGQSLASLELVSFISLVGLNPLLSLHRSVA